jgi:hypothetical protein
MRGPRDQDPSPRGKARSLHAVENERRAVHTPGNTRITEWKKEGPEGPRVQEEQSDYTQPRSFIAVATRSMATMYAALRM